MADDVSGIQFFPLSLTFGSLYLQLFFESNPSDVERIMKGFLTPCQLLPPPLNLGVLSVGFFFEAGSKENSV